MQKTKVVHLITDLDQGGAEIMLYKLLLNMDNNQFENVVISMIDEGVFGEKLKKSGVPVYCLYMKAGVVSISAILKYYRLIKKLRPDIVQAWMYHANMLSIIAKPFLPKHKVIFNVRCGLERFKKTKKLTKYVIKMNAWFSRYAAVIIYNSLRSQIQHQVFGFCGKNAVYIPNGFELDLFQPDKVIYQEFRKKYQLDEKSKIVGMIARFHPDKNPRGFIETAKNVIKNIGQDSVFFVLAGRGCDHKNRQLSAWVKSVDLNDNLILLGGVDSSQLLPAFDVYLSTSWSEGFPNVIGEAMACGVPCVVTDVGESKTIVSSYGYVTPVGRYDKLAQKVGFLLKEIKGRGDRIRQHIAENYNISDIVDEYQKLYSNVIISG